MKLQKFSQCPPRIFSFFTLFCLFLFGKILKDVGVSVKDKMVEEKKDEAAMNVFGISTQLFRFRLECNRRIRASLPTLYSHTSRSHMFNFFIDLVVGVGDATTRLAARRPRSSTLQRFQSDAWVRESYFVVFVTFVYPCIVYSVVVRSSLLRR